MCPMGITFTSEIKPNPLQKPNIKHNTENTKLINQKTFCLSTCLELGLHRRHVLHEGKRLQSRQNLHRLTLRLIPLDYFPLTIASASQNLLLLHWM
ncbi:unnamed protein product [Brassica oleracea var. botrytis]|nr:unnamed protein product [Brassica oleracea]